MEKEKLERKLVVRMGIFDRFVKNRAHDVAEHNTELQPIEESGISASDNSISLLAQQNVIEVNAIPKQSDTVTIPISELGMLGSTAASLLPSFRTVTQAASINTSGLFRLANAAAGDKLKQAKDGNFWGAFYRADGSSKFAKLAETGPINGTSTTIMPINPATVMVVGVFGVHRFYVGKIGTGILYFLTVGCFGIGWLIDMVTIACGVFRDSQGNYVKDW